MTAYGAVRYVAGLAGKRPAAGKGGMRKPPASTRRGLRFVQVHV